MAVQRRMPWSEAAGYTGVQILGCCAGALLAHAMFALPLLQAGTHVRAGPAQWLAEFVATFGLLLIVLGHQRSRDAPWMIAAWIGAAYWFTASTSFANPAITVGRMFSATFAGIAPSSAPVFIAAQVVGGAFGLVVIKLLYPRITPGEAATAVVPHLTQEAGTTR